MKTFTLFLLLTLSLFILPSSCFAQMDFGPDPVASFTQIEMSMTPDSGSHESVSDDTFEVGTESLSGIRNRWYF